ncbi:MAG: hypothetical protein ACT4NU_05920 [Chromatiales bacterium]
MKDDTGELKRAVLVHVLRINAVIQGIATGLLLGTGVFVATNWLILKGGDTIGPHLALLGQFFIGYTVTFVGSLIGFGYGFISGFALGYFVGVIYNWVTDLRELSK